MIVEERFGGRRYLPGNEGERYAGPLLLVVHYRIAIPPGFTSGSAVITRAGP
jgi:hypothetical protein